MGNLRFKTFEDFMQAIINLSDEKCRHKYNLSLSEYYKSDNLSLLRLNNTRMFRDDDIRKLWLDGLLPAVTYEISQVYVRVYSKSRYVTEEDIKIAASELLSKVENNDIIRDHIKQLTPLITRIITNKYFLS